MSKCNFKKRLWHRCFPENFPKFLRTPFLTTTSAYIFGHSLLAKVWKQKVQKIAKIAIIHVKESNHDKIEGRLHVSK